MCKHQELDRHEINSGFHLSKRKDSDAFFKDVGYVCSDRSLRNRGVSHLIERECILKVHTTRVFRQSTRSKILMECLIK